MINKSDALDIWAVAMRAEGQSRYTIRRRIGTTRALGVFIRRDPATATTSEIQTFLSQWTNRETLSAYFGDLHAFWVHLQLAAGGEQSVSDPTARMRRPRKPVGVPRPVDTLALHQAMAVTTDRDLYAQVILAAYEGERVHEIAAIRGEYVQDRKLLVPGKGGRLDWIPLHPLVAAEAAKRPASGYWFPSWSASGHITENAITRRVRELFAAIGVHATPHRLRHWCATELLESGADLRQVQTLMRHASVATTERYTRVNQSKLFAAMQALPQPAYHRVA